MPAKSEKQAKLFRLVKALQHGKIPSSKVSKNVRQMAKKIKPNVVNDFTKVKENSINEEGEYSSSKLKVVRDKSLNQLLSENPGKPFNKEELTIFQNNQNDFAGFGKTTFLYNKKENTITAEIFSEGSTKKFIFKKLSDVESKNINKYAVFVQKTYPNKPEKEIFYILSNNFSNDDLSVKTKMLGDFIDRINSYGL